MAEKYLKELIEVMDNVRFKDVSLEYKHFFSGAAVYVNGKICMSLTPVGFALKLSEESRKFLKKEKGAKPLRYFPKAPIKKEYVILPNEMLSDQKELNLWIKESVKYVKKANF